MFQEINRIKTFDKGFYRLIISFIVTVCLAAIFIFVLLLKEIAINQKFGETLGKLNIYEDLSRKRNVPSEERLKYLSEQLNHLKEIYEHLPTKLLYQRSIQDVLEKGNPVLAFKETLFDTKQALKHKASSNGTALPEAYGLEEFERRLPAKKDLPELYSKLEVMREVLDILLSNSEIQVQQFAFTEIVLSEFSEQDTKNFEELFIRISFDSSYEPLMQFLETLIAKKNMYQISSIDISAPDEKAQTSGVLSIELFLNLFKIKDPVKND